MYKKTFTHLLHILVFFAIIHSGYAQNETSITTPNITQLKVGGYIKVELIEGTEEKVVFDVSPAAKKLIKVKSKKGKLSILAKNKRLKLLSYKKNKVKVYYKQLEAIKVRNGASLKGQSLIQSKNFDLTAIEGATIELKLQTKDLKAKISTGAEVLLSGTTDTFDTKVTMGAVLSAYDYKSNVCFVRTSMGASAKVFAREFLQMLARMGSSIKYQGKPKRISRSRSYMGSHITPKRYEGDNNK